MIIKEGSIVSIVDKNNNFKVIEKINVEEDIEIEGNGSEYTFLLRTEGNEENSIFESDEIIKTGANYYEVKGYFKDAILVISRHGKNAQSTMHESYTMYD